MKKLILISGILALSSSLYSVTSSAQEGFSSPQKSAAESTTQGFNGAGTSNFHSVRQALDSRDDSHVTLKGKITEAIGGERYSFQDETGDIVIEIEHDEWHGLNVTPDTTLVISGEIDREWASVKVDVGHISIAQ